MNPFSYMAAEDVGAAMRATSQGAEVIAGGTDMLQLLQEEVRHPPTLVDINQLPLKGIAIALDGVLIGALTTLADAADSPDLQKRFPVLVEALFASASPQVRNMATVGGNLLQRTRCLYFRDIAMRCNKREPGTGCPAWDGRNRMNAILGGSEHCIAVNASDMAVALVVLDAEVMVRGPNGERSIRAEEFHKLPGTTPHIEVELESGELIEGIWIPTMGDNQRSHYVKVRDRASFEFALASCAASLHMDGEMVLDARIAAGGVGTKPWRLPQVEEALKERPLTESLIREAASCAAEGARPREDNAFKAPLLERTVRRTLTELMSAP